MHKNASLKLLFVVNPVSGGKEKNDREAALRELIGSLPHTAAFYIMTGEGDKRSIQHYIERWQPDRVIAVGGDGTVKLVAGILKETSLPMGIIPAGSANGMARELSIPSDLPSALQIILEGEEKPVDLIRINEEEICIHLSDVGLNALLIRYFEDMKGRGMWGYARAIVLALWNKRKMRASIQTDETTVKRKAYMVVIANARKYGTGANINPGGDVGDGVFEVVVVRKINMLEIVKAVFTNRPFHPRRVEVFSARDVQLTLQNKASFQVDGEFMGKTSRVHARIMPGMLRVMIPAEKKNGLA